MWSTYFRESQHLLQQAGLHEGGQGRGQQQPRPQAVGVGAPLLPDDRDKLIYYFIKHNHKSLSPFVNVFNCLIALNLAQ